VIGTNGLYKYSNVILVRKNGIRTLVTIQPNPAITNTTIRLVAEKEGEATIRIIDDLGKTALTYQQKVNKGYNTIILNDLSRLSSGVYSVQIIVNNDIVTKKLIIQNN
jgi:hypothetical protein